MPADMAIRRPGFADRLVRVVGTAFTERANMEIAAGAP